jgi:hypothetical protein
MWKRPRAAGNVKNMNTPARQGQKTGQTGTGLILERGIYAASPLKAIGC